MNVIAITEVKTAALVAFWNENFNRVQGDFKEIKKFADRATAEKRTDLLVAKLSATFEEYHDVQEGWMPAPEGYEGISIEDFLAQSESVANGDETDNAGSTEGATVEGSDAASEPEADAEEETDSNLKPIPAGHNAFNMLVGAVAAAQKQAEETGEPIVGASRSSSKASNSEGVAASWADNEVRASRLKRDGVMVELEGANHGPFKSTYEAFRALRLPNNKHIRFRLKLKESFRDKGEGYVFEHNGKKYNFTIVPAAAE